MESNGSSYYAVMDEQRLQLVNNNGAMKDTLSIIQNAVGKKYD